LGGSKWVRWIAAGTLWGACAPPEVLEAQAFIQGDEVVLSVSSALPTVRVEGEPIELTGGHYEGRQPLEAFGPGEHKWTVSAADSVKMATVVVPWTARVAFKSCTAPVEGTLTIGDQAIFCSAGGRAIEVGWTGPEALKLRVGRQDAADADTPLHFDFRFEAVSIRDLSARWEMQPVYRGRAGGPGLMGTSVSFQALADAEAVVQRMSRHGWQSRMEGVALVRPSGEVVSFSRGDTFSSVDRIVFEDEVVVQRKTCKGYLTPDGAPEPPREVEFIEKRYSVVSSGGKTVASRSFPPSTSRCPTSLHMEPDGVTRVRPQVEKVQRWLGVYLPPQDIVALQ